MTNSFSPSFLYKFFHFLPTPMVRKVKKLKDPNAPKRPLSSYFLFAANLRATEGEELTKKPVAEQGKYISEQWNSASAEVKEKFNKEAQKLREEYEKKLEEYKKTPEYKEFMEKKSEAEKKEKKKPKTKQKQTGVKLFVGEFKEKLTDEEKKEIGGAAAINKRAMEAYKELESEEKAEYEERAKEANSDSE